MEYEKLIAVIITGICSLISVIVSGLIGYFVNKNLQAKLEATKNENNRLLELLKAKLVNENQEKLATLTKQTQTEITQLSANLNAQNQASLAHLTATLSEMKAEKDARRDYEYEARKRLYEKCEPLLFQLNESAEDAFFRINSLARTASHGDLGKDGWLSRKGYYMISTIYFLLKPLVIIRLIQKQLTMVDLTLDPRINMKYAIAKKIYISLSSDFEFSKLDPVLEYEPIYKAEDAKKRENKPEIYCKQGIPKGWLDNIVDSLIVKETNNVERCMSLGEFEYIYKDETSEKGKNFWIITELFYLFEPQTRPVLWRILVTQAFLYKTVLDIKYLSLDNGSLDKQFRQIVLDKQTEILENLFCYVDESQRKNLSKQLFGVVNNYLES